MRPRTMMIATVLAALSFSAGSRAEDALLLSDATRSDGASFIEQLRAAPSGRIVLLNTFLVPEGETEAFQQGWAKAAEVLRRQPGFVSTVLHKPLGGSRLWSITRSGTAPPPLRPPWPHRNSGRRPLP